MDKKKAHTKAGSTDRPNSNDNSAHNQRLRLLDYLLEHGSITTQKARELLDIYYPPSRINELRQAGYQIHTAWDNWVSALGIKHRIGRYVLVHKEPYTAHSVDEAAA